MILERVLTEHEIIIQILIAVLVGLGFFITIIIMELHTYFSSKIHNSYHKGYNKAKDDKVEYYKTIKEITDSFNIIFNELTKEGSGYMYKASTLELMLDFKISLMNYYNN